jgi:hypothetical protein
MADDNTNAMIQAGFVQANPPPVVQPPVTQTVVTPTTANVGTSDVGTNVSPTTIVSGTDNTVNFSSIIQDNSGGVSSIRVLMLLWGCGVFLVWMTATIVGMFHGIYVIPTIPQTVVEVLISVTGIKAVQRFGEK